MEIRNPFRNRYERVHFHFTFFNSLIFLHEVPHLLTDMLSWTLVMDSWFKAGFGFYSEYIFPQNDTLFIFQVNKIVIAQVIKTH